MANPFTGTDAAFSPIDYLTPDVAESQRQLRRQQAVVDLLRQRALEDDSQTQIVSGWAIPQSGFKPLTKLANALLAGKMQQGVDAKQSEIAKRYAEALGGAGAATTGTGGIIDPETLRQAAILDAVSPGAGKSLIQSRIDQNKPVDVVRTAQQLFPNDPAAQQQYLQGYARKQTEMTRTPGSYVVGMDGQMVETPMSAADKRRLELMERSTAASESRAQTAAREAQQAVGTGGGFAGQSMDAQAYNTRNRLTLAAMERPLSAEEQLMLQSAERHLRRPQVVMNEGGVSVIEDTRPLPTVQATPSAADQTGAPAPSTPAAALVVSPPMAPPRQLTPRQTQQKILDTAQAEAQLALPDIEDAVTKGISELERLLNDPNLGSLIGNPPGVLTKRISGQPAADIDAALRQVKGGAFLTAIEKLRGFGAVSGAEGDKAGAAITSLSELQSVPKFKEEGQVYIEILRKGLQRAREKAGVAAKAPTAPSAGAGETLTPEEQAELEMRRRQQYEQYEQMRGQR